MKRLLSVILAAAVVFALPALALADSYEGKTWNVTFNSSGKISDDYSSKEYADQIKQLQPGDDVTFKVMLHHDNSMSADWYIKNEVVKSLEDASNAAGSAYTYKLEYTGPSTSATLFDSKKVGGDSGSGLHDADSNGYIYLDKLSKGQTGIVTLYVKLDGETEGNDYFNTLADLKLSFAVEPEESGNGNNNSNNNSSNKNNSSGSSSSVGKTAVKTGDDTRLFPFYVAMLVSGILFAALAVVSYRERKKEETEVQR